MEYRTINKTKDKISLLGLGAMRLDLKDEENTIEVIKTSVDNGINLIDTAYLYGNGDNEKALGKALKKLNLREKVKISTKLNRLKVKTKKDMEDMLTEELESLQTGYIDYYFIHNITSYDDLEKLKKIGLYEFLDKLKENKTVLNVGFSFHGRYEEFEKVIEDYSWDMVLVQYNYLDENYQAGAKGIEYASKKGLGVFIMEPLKGGLLAGKMPEDLETLIQTSSKGKIELALKWIKENPNVTCILSGMTNTTMLKENIKVINDETQLNSKDLELISKIKEKILELNKVNCTGCNYCMPCPRGVYIPDCFKLYNEKYLFNEKQFGVSMSYIRYVANLMGLTGERHDGSLCTNCGKCLRECPQHINIPEELNNVSSTFHTRFTSLLVPILRRLMNIFM